MGQLQELNGYILEGDVEALSVSLDRSRRSRPISICYTKLRGYWPVMDLCRKPIIFMKRLLIHLPDEAQLKIDRASTLIELGRRRRSTSTA